MGMDADEDEVITKTGEKPSEEAPPEEVDKIIGSITVSIAGKDFTRTLFASESIMSLLKRTAQNGKDPADALAELAEIGQAAMCGGINPEDYRIRFVNMTGEEPNIIKK